jgi:hypothetical protein
MADARVRLSVEGGAKAADELRMVGKTGKESLDKLAESAKDLPPHLRLIDNAVVSLAGDMPSLRSEMEKAGKTMADLEKGSAKLDAALAQISKEGGTASFLDFLKIDPAKFAGWDTAEKKIRGISTAIAGFDDAGARTNLIEALGIGELAPIVDGAVNSLDAMEGKLAMIGTVGLGVFAAVGAAAMASVQFANESMDWADKLGQTAEDANVSTEALQRWRFGAEELNGSSEALDRALSSVAKSMKAVLDGSASVEDLEAWAKIGITPEQLASFGSLEVAFPAIIEGLEGITDKAERAQLAERLGLGALSDQLDKGAGAFRRFSNSADEMVGVVGGASVDALRSASTELKDAERAAERAGEKLKNSLLPWAIALANAMAGIATQAARAIDAITRVGAAEDRRDQIRSAGLNRFMDRGDRSFGSRVGGLADFINPEVRQRNEALNGRPTPSPGGRNRRGDPDQAIANDLASDKARVLGSQLGRGARESLDNYLARTARSLPSAASSVSSGGRSRGGSSASRPPARASRGPVASRTPRAPATPRAPRVEQIPAALRATIAEIERLTSKAEAAEAPVETLRAKLAAFEDAGKKGKASLADVATASEVTARSMLEASLETAGLDRETRNLFKEGRLKAALDAATASTLAYATQNKAGTLSAAEMDAQVAGLTRRLVDQGKAAQETADFMEAAAKSLRKLDEDIAASDARIASARDNRIEGLRADIETPEQMRDRQLALLQDDFNASQGTATAMTPEELARGGAMIEASYKRAAEAIRGVSLEQQLLIGLIDGSVNSAQDFLKVILAWAQQKILMAVLDPNAEGGSFGSRLAGAFGGGKSSGSGGGGGIGGFLQSLFSPKGTTTVPSGASVFGHAHGGLEYAGQTFIAGESGPEIVRLPGNMAGVARISDAQSTMRQAMAYAENARVPMATAVPSAFAPTTVTATVINQLGVPGRAEVKSRSDGQGGLNLEIVMRQFEDKIESRFNDFKAGRDDRDLASSFGLRRPLAGS